MASNIPICTNPCNPSYTVAITTTRKRESEILFGSTHPSAKMLQQISEKNFFLYCLNIFPPTTDITRSPTNRNVKLNYSCMPNMGSAQRNKQVLIRLSSADTETPPCNFRNKRDCPLKRKCRTKSVITRHQYVHQTAKRCHIMAVVRRILKLVTTTISKALKLRSRDTRQSSLGLFGDSKIRVTFRS